MYSPIECAISKTGNIIVPTQLLMVIRMARRDPYILHEMQCSSIPNWKEYSRERCILGVCTSTEGHSIDWTKIMQICITKAKGNTILCKTFHEDAEF